MIWKLRPERKTLFVSRRVVLRPAGFAGFALRVSLRVAVLSAILPSSAGFDAASDCAFKGELRARRGKAKVDSCA